MAICVLNVFFLEKKENYKAHCAFKHEHNKVQKRLGTDLTAAH